MSVDATKFVWSLSKNIVSPLEKLILLAIADRCGERGECWPSISRLATDTGLDKRSIVRHRNKLINQKILRYTGEFKGRSNQIPVMQLMVDEWREGDYIEDEIDQGQAVTSDTQTLVPGAGCHGYQGQAVIRNLKEEPIKEPITSFSYPDTLYQSTETSILLYEKKQSDESFDLFYKIYPIQKNENRARNAWLAQRCWERFEEIITALNALILHDAHFKDGYAPNPDKWILEEKWKDKPVKRKSRNSSQAYTVEDSSRSTWGNSKKGLI